MKDKKINIFIPGRLCLFGEHTDWAGLYRTTNSKLLKGQAIVTGIEQGIYATVEPNDKFIVTSDLEIYHNEYLECEMDSQKLVSIAQQGGFFSYVAGVASYINDNYLVGGLKITVTEMDLPIKSGLSSSAAICVLVARGFNRIYHLKMNTQGEMQAAFRGEQRTPSRCGRLDQACAYGIKPVLMDFDGLEINTKELRLGSTFHWVIANLNASKDTIKILSDLNKAFPFAENEKEIKVQEALGKDNLSLNEKVIRALEDGNPEQLGHLMNDAQRNFDYKVAPMCSELVAPVLHEVINDPNITPWIYGAKGVGSQGDGSVQFLAKSESDSQKLCDYLTNVRKMSSFSLTLKPGQKVKKAIIPLAGFGTRVFPATKNMKKCFLPILDSRGVLKPALMIMLEQLLEAGIEDICLVIGEEDKNEFDNFFAPVPRDNYEKLSLEKKEIQWEITKLSEHITYVIQKERKGFGHAVWLCRSFTNNDPVLLMLGDFLYKSYNKDNCCKQVMDAYNEYGKLLVSVQNVPLEKVVHYGILHGTWEDETEKTFIVDSMVEKPTDDYAKEYLGVSNGCGDMEYYATFGQYVLIPEVFEELEKQIKNDVKSEGDEFGLTAALVAVKDRYGMIAYKPEGKCFDIGLPQEYRRTMIEFSE